MWLMDLDIVILCGSSQGICDGNGNSDGNSSGNSNSSGSDNGVPGILDGFRDSVMLDSVEERVGKVVELLADTKRK